MQNTNEGRIRLTTMRVTVQDGDQLVDTVVSVRHGWEGAVPDHDCDADLCETCTGLAGRKAIRKLSTAGEVSRNAAKATAFQTLRDGQGDADKGYTAVWPARHKGAK
jgi:hypothetical protein